LAQLHGLRTRLKPGMEQAYTTAHEAIWPSLLQAQRGVGITGWWIFRSGLDLFHVARCEADFERALSSLAESPVNRRWLAEIGRYTESDPLSGPTTERLALIYHR
jgi:L-rhamnose mutarotase